MGGDGEMKIGIMGSGEIVSGMLAMMQQTGTFQCSALFCREESHERGAALAEKFGIDTLYHNQEEFFADDSFDTVYIAVINSQHYSYTRNALAHDRNVICEKPFTSTYEQACELNRLAEEKNLMLYEMKRGIVTENYARIRKALPEIGVPAMALSSLCHRSRRYDQYLAHHVAPVFDPACDGGALYDMGVYAVHFMVGLFGMPESAVYRKTVGYNGIDLDGALTMQYPGLMCMNMISKTVSVKPSFTIIGSNGHITSDSSVMLPGRTLLVLNSGEERVIAEDSKTIYTDELRVLSQKLAEHDTAFFRSQMQNTLMCMKILEYAGKRGGL